MVSAIEAIQSKLLDKPLINQFISTRRKAIFHNIWGGDFFHFFPNASTLRCHTVLAMLELEEEKLFMFSLFTRRWKRNEADEKAIRINNEYLCTYLLPAKCSHQAIIQKIRKRQNSLSVIMKNMLIMLILCINDRFNFFHIIRFSHNWVSSILFVL